MTAALKVDRERLSALGLLLVTLGLLLFLLFQGRKHFHRRAFGRKDQYSIPSGFGGCQGILVGTEASGGGAAQTVRQTTPRGLATATFVATVVY